MKKKQPGRGKEASARPTGAPLAAVGGSRRRHSRVEEQPAEEGRCGARRGVCPSALRSPLAHPLPQPEKESWGEVSLSPSHSRALWGWSWSAALPVDRVLCGDAAVVERREPGTYHSLPPDRGGCITAIRCWDKDGGGLRGWAPIPVHTRYLSGQLWPESDAKYGELINQLKEVHVTELQIKKIAHAQTRLFAS